MPADSLRNVYPEAKEQRCWNHRICNALDNVPKARQAQARLLLTKIPYAPTQQEAERLKAVYQRWCRQQGLEAAAQVLDRDWERMLTFYQFPAAHWVHLRTSNAIESPFAALRLRTDAAKRFKKVENATAVIWKMLLVAQVEWLKKVAPASVSERRQMIEPGHDRIPVGRQCELVGRPRTSFYYRPRPITVLEELLMRLIDEVYTRCPFYGVRRITAWLRRQGHEVNPKRVRRLMRRMGLEALYQRRTLSIPAHGQTKCPYLLRDLSIERPDQVWATDITYARLASGFVYLTVIMDWHSRYVLSWEISTSMETTFCLTALDRALAMSTPEIFNSTRDRSSPAPSSPDGSSTPAC